jgi:Mg-chelatase subunit ChlD
MGEKEKAMDVYILLDRTGSMAPIWVEAVSSVNTYVKELTKDGAQDRITLAVFDAYERGMQFDVLRNAVKVDEWKPVGEDEVTPRGMTPLLDALVRIITRAEEVNNKKTAIVVMTDGYENASREVDYKAAKAAIDRVVKKDWQVNFLGADFAGIDQAENLGVSRERSMNYVRGHADRAMASTAERHRQYRQSVHAIDFEAEDRQNAGEDEVK